VLIDVYLQMSDKLKEAKIVLRQLDDLRDELYPLARRATMLYSVVRSLATVHREYHFSLPFFLKLFDEAVGGEFPAEYAEDSDDEEVSLLRKDIYPEKIWNIYEIFNVSLFVEDYEEEVSSSQAQGDRASSRASKDEQTKPGDYFSYSVFVNFTIFCISSFIYWLKCF